MLGDDWVTAPATHSPWGTMRGSRRGRKCIVILSPRQYFMVTHVAKGQAFFTNSSTILAQPPSTNHILGPWWGGIAGHQTHIQTTTSGTATARHWGPYDTILTNELILIIIGCIGTHAVFPCNSSCTSFLPHSEVTMRKGLMSSTTLGRHRLQAAAGVGTLSTPTSPVRRILSRLFRPKIRLWILPTREQ